MMTDAMYAVGVLICLCLQGFAIFWLLLSIFVVAHDIHKAPFTLNYWSALYPLGVFALTFGQLASDFNSPTFRTCNTIVTCCVSPSPYACMYSTPRVESSFMLIRIYPAIR